MGTGSSVKREGDSERRDFYDKFDDEVEIDWAQRGRLDKWLRVMRIQRHIAWAAWLKAQRARSGGKITRWAQRRGAEEGYTGLRPEQEGYEQTTSTRLEKAADAWESLWTGGTPYQVQEWSALEPITGGQIRETLRSTRERKGGGDGWMGASKTGTLVEHMAGCLGTHDGGVGRKLQWPGHLRQVIFSMIPKPKAETEAGLGPTGLLPYTYRVRMARRKRQQKVVFGYT